MSERAKKIGRGVKGMYYPQNNYTYPQAYGQPQIALQGYPVPDERTAREAQVNTNGTISVFPDIQNGKIYTKQLDMNSFNPMQMMGNNPIMQMMEMLQNSNNPQAVMEKLASQNPQLQQAMRLSQGKNPQQLQQMAANLAKEKGVNLQEFMKQMGINRP